MLGSILISIGISAVLGLLTAVALRLFAWILDVAISAIADLIRKIGEMVVAFIKRKELEGLLELIEKEAKKAAKNSDMHAKIQEAFGDLYPKVASNQIGLAIPLDNEGEMDWRKVKVIEADNPSADNMPDSMLVTRDERYRPLMY